MSTMLELYRHRYGEGVKKQGNGWNGPCPFCGGENGKSDRFMIWPDREKDLGHTCIENHIPGVFFCRHCGRTGDSIRYMMDMEGMSFREACAELGISDMPVRPRRRPAPLEPQVRAAWQPSVLSNEILEQSALQLLHTVCANTTINTDMLLSLRYRRYKMYL